MTFHGTANGGTHAPGSSRGDESQEHRCARCWGPFGKSAIRCPNEPEAKEVDHG